MEAMCEIIDKDIDPAARANAWAEELHNLAYDGKKEKRLLPDTFHIKAAEYLNLVADEGNAEVLWRTIKTFLCPPYELPIDPGHEDFNDTFTRIHALTLEYLRKIKYNFPEAY